MAKSKHKKLRVAFRKNRQKRSRSQNLTRQALDESAAAEDLQTSERLSGKGELTRRRTILGVEDEAGLLRDVDESKCLWGRVLSAIGLNSIVRAEDGTQYECTVRRVIRTMARDARNAVVTGDHVLIQPLDNLQGVIERVQPRRGTLSRGAGRREHILVANVDQVLVVASAADPPLKQNLIDRFLVSAEKGEVAAIVCINKIDLVEPATLQSIVGMYGRLGYEVVLTSATKSIGISRLQSLLKDCETVLTGQSGVGKTALLNAVQPGLRLQTGGISNWTRKGRHTTRRATLLELDFGGWVVDTPGIRQFELWDVMPEEVEGYFVEFRPFVTLCKFPDCTHTHESSCGVKGAVESDCISRRRYDSYLRMIQGDIAPSN